MSRETDIAIIGMMCHYPGADGPDEYWKLLKEGIEPITYFSDEELLKNGIPEVDINNSNYVKGRAILHDVDKFDAGFFQFSPSEAAVMDPQQRLMLETAYHALEHAGYNPDEFDGLIGIYAGIGINDYLMGNLLPNMITGRIPNVFQMMIGNNTDFLATKIAYKLNLRGPALNVQSACSTALSAIHLAGQSILNGECDMALAGGVSLGRFPMRAGYMYQEGMILSPDGHCRPFDDQARGTIPGSGSGMVVLKLLEDAIEDGDTIYSVIRGTAINNDGAQKVNYTAPGVEGQATVIREALNITGITPEEIGYIEAHGTGTELGDPIEISALTQAYGEGPQRESIPVGSVKSNFGHTDAAAGVAGVIKCALSLKNGEIPPSLNFRTPNQKINFKETPFFINTELRKFERKNGSRKAAVSSFGIGGTNVHAILEEPPETEESGPFRERQLLVISARSGDALEQARENMIRHLESHGDINAADVAYTMSMGRRAFSQRIAVVASSVAETVAALKGERPELLIRGEHNDTMSAPGVAFLYSGQGAQYENMGRELYENESEFRKAVDECAEILKDETETDIRDLLYPDEGKESEAAELLKETRYTQIALFVIEYAMTRLWISYGIFPEALIGHSVGEITAACVSGVFRLEDALSLVALRGRLMQEMPEGKMLAVSVSEEELSPHLDEFELSLGAVNAPGLCVASGETDRITALQKKLEGKGVSCRELHTSHAFHSHMMDGVIEEFVKKVSETERNAPQIPFVSNLTGSYITNEEATDPEYWGRHLRQAVRFSDGIRVLFDHPGRILLEVGPGRTLASLASSHPDRGADRTVLSSMPHPKEREKHALEFLLLSLGRLWLKGVKVDWYGYYENEERKRIALPLYPFERKRYWIESLSLSKLLAGQGDAIEFSESVEGADSKEKVASYDRHARPSLGTPYREPENELQRRLVALWEDMLGVEPVGINDNFFELGGHSLLVAEMTKRLRDEFDPEIPLQALFESPTVADLATTLARLAGGTDIAIEQEADRGGSENKILEDAERLREALIEDTDIAASLVRLVRVTDKSDNQYALLEARIGPSDPNKFDSREKIERWFEDLAGRVDVRSLPHNVVLDTLIADNGSVEEASITPESLSMDPAKVDLHPYDFESFYYSSWLKGVAKTDAPRFAPAAAQSIPLQYEGGMVQYRSVAGIIRIDEPVDREHLGRVMQTLMDRHLLLRCFVVENSGNQEAPYELQEVRSEVVESIPEIDLSYHDLSEKEVILDHVYRELLSRPFDLSQWPAFRILLIRENLKSYRLIWATSHFYSDASTYGSVWLPEFRTLYHGLKKEKGFALPEPAEDYRSYLKLLQTDMTMDKLPNETEYLKQFFAAVSRVNGQLQTHKSENAGMTSLTLTVSGETLKNLQKRFEGYQSAHIFMSLYALSIAKWLRLDQAVMAQIYHGRSYNGRSFFQVAGDLGDRLPILLNAGDKKETEDIVKEILEVQSRLNQNRTNYWTLTERLLKDHQVDLEKDIRIPFYFNYLEFMGQGAPGQSESINSSDPVVRMKQSIEIFSKVDNYMRNQIITEIHYRGGEIPILIFAEGFYGESIEEFGRILEKEILAHTS